MGDLAPVRLTPALVEQDGQSVNIDGSVQPVLWLGGWIGTPGDVVMVLIADDRAVVMGSPHSLPRPLTGTVTGAASSGRVPVSTDLLGTIQCRYVGTAPSVSALVRLDWNSSTPWLFPSGAAAPAPPPPDPPAPPPAPKPPPVVTTGVLDVLATNSGSYQVGGNWAAMGTTVRQDRWGSARENRGAWFYGNRAAQLRGRTVTRVAIRLGARLRIGNYNSTIALQVYRHTNATRPAGDVNRVAGPQSLSMPAGMAARWFDLPTAWGQALVDSGGGIGVMGSPYAGVEGVGDNPASGQLKIWWRR